MTYFCYCSPEYERVDPEQKWLKWPFLKQRLFRELRMFSGWNVAERKLKKWKSGRHEYLVSHAVNCHSGVLLISVSPSTFVFLSIIPSLAASLCSFNYIVQGSEADIWVLHRGTWTWATAGHTSHTSLTHTLFGQSHERELWEGLLGWQHTTQLGWKSERNVSRVNDANADKRMQGGEQKVTERKGGVGNAEDRDKRELKGWMEDASRKHSSIRCDE